jgi:hypothetical protein
MIGIARGGDASHHDELNVPLNPRPRHDYRVRAVTVLGVRSDEQPVASAVAGTSRVNRPFDTEIGIL